MAENDGKCYECGEDLDLSYGGTGFCKKCADRKFDEAGKYMDSVQKYVEENRITTRTRFALWWSCGLWRSFGELVKPAPEKLKTPVKSSMGYRQIYAELGSIKQQMGTSSYSTRVYLARTGEALKFPLDDIIIVLEG